MKHEHNGEVNHTWDFPEGLKARAAQVKKHLQENKATYLTGAGCLVAGYLLRKPQTITVIQEATAPVFNNMPTISPVISPVIEIANNAANGGYARKIVRCLETDEMWPSMTKAAEAAGYSVQTMSKHIHGVTDHLDGLHYVIEGLAA